MKLYFSGGSSGLKCTKVSSKSRKIVFFLGESNGGRGIISLNIDLRVEFGESAWCFWRIWYLFLCGVFFGGGNTSYFCENFDKAALASINGLVDMEANTTEAEAVAESFLMGDLFWLRQHCWVSCLLFLMDFVGVLFTIFDAIYLRKHKIWENGTKFSRGKWGLGDNTWSCLKYVFQIYGH